MATDNKTTHITGTDKKGNKIVKVGDKFFTVDKDGKPTKTEVKPADVKNTAVSAKTSPLTMNDGKDPKKPQGTVATPDQPDSLATAGDIANAINNAGFNVKTNGKDSGDKLVKMGNTLEINQGKNIDIERAGKKFTIKTKDDVTFNSVQFGKDGPKISNKDGNINVGDKDNKPTAISNVKSTLPGTVGNDPLTETGPVLAPSLTANQKQHAATVDDVINTGWNLETAGLRYDNSVKHNKVDFVKAYDTVEFKAGAGLKIDDKTNGKKSEIEFKLADTDELKKKAKNDVAGTGDGLIVVAQPELNDGNGFVSAKNIAQAINSSGWNLQENASQKDLVSPSNIVNFVNGAGTTVKIDSDGKTSNVVYNVATDDKTTQITGTDTNGNKIVKVGDTFFTLDKDGKPTTTAVNPADVANTAVSAKTGDIVDADKAGLNGKVKANAGDENAVATVGNVVNAINSVSHKIKATNTEQLATATDGEKVMKAGEELTLEAGKNLNVQADGDKFILSTKKSVEFDNVKVGKVNINKDKGIDAGGTKITNVAKGTEPNDAVNVSQLKGFSTNIDNKLDQMAGDARAGTASAMAMAGLPQAYIPGKSMIVGGTSYYHGEGAVAVGLSKLSDNGRWIFKTGISADTGGEVGGTFGFGMHF